MQIQVSETRLELIEDDITKLDTDAIVNAANERLAHGGGVAGAVARSGGPVIQKESDEWVRKHGRVPTGSAAITSGGDLRAKYVIHAVGPVYRSASPTKAAQELSSAVKAALRMADEHDLQSIALPAISTGIFGYPLAEAAEVMLKAAIAYVRSGTGLERIIFCLHGSAAFNAFVRALQALVDGLDEVPRQARDRFNTV